MLWSLKGGGVMSKERAIMHYTAAVAIFRRWLELELITPDEFNIISTKTGEKYGLHSTSIFLEITPK